MRRIFVILGLLSMVGTAHAFSGVAGDVGTSKIWRSSVTYQPLAVVLLDSAPIVIHDMILIDSTGNPSAQIGFWNGKSISALSNFNNFVATYTLRPDARNGAPLNFGLSSGAVISYNYTVGVATMGVQILWDYYSPAYIPKR